MATRLPAEPELPARSLTIGEVARRLSVSQATVYRHVRQGLLPHFRFGGSLRVRESDLEEFIAQQQRGAREEPPGPAAERPRGRARVQAWLEIVRPFSWTASIVPVGLGAVLAWRDDGFDAGVFALVLAAALALQAGTNIINEVFDVRNEVDSIDSPRASKVLLQGRLTLSEAFRGGLVCLGIAVVIGGYLTALRGPAMFAIGFVGLLGGYFYTAPPLHYKYRALGVPLVFLLMGPLMVFGAYYAISGQVDAQPWLVAVPAGLLVAAILHANDVRDVDDDRRAGFRTLSTIVGQERGAAFYIGLVLGAYAVVLVLAGTGVLPWWALLTLVTLPGSIAAIRAIMAGTGLRPEPQAEGRTDAPSASSISRIDVMTAQTHLTFGLLLALALILEEAAF